MANQAITQFPIAASSGYLLVEPLEMEKIGNLDIPVTNKSEYIIKKGRVVSQGGAIFALATTTLMPVPATVGDTVFFRIPYGNDPITHEARRFHFVEFKDVVGVVREK